MIMITNLRITIFVDGSFAFRACMSINQSYICINISEQVTGTYNVKPRLSRLDGVILIACLLIYLFIYM